MVDNNLFVHVRQAALPCRFPRVALASSNINSFRMLHLLTFVYHFRRSFGNMLGLRLGIFWGSDSWGSFGFCLKYVGSDVHPFLIKLRRH